MRWPAVTGQEVPGPGSGVRQTMLLLADHSMGRSFSGLVPRPCGPRNCVHSAPVAVLTAQAKSKMMAWRCWRVMVPPGLTARTRFGVGGRFYGVHGVLQAAVSATPLSSFIHLATPGRGRTMTEVISQCVATS